MRIGCILMRTRMYGLPVVTFVCLFLSVVVLCNSITASKHSHYTDTDPDHTDTDQHSDSILEGVGRNTPQDQNGVVEAQQAADIQQAPFADSQGLFTELDDSHLRNKLSTWRQSLSATKVGSLLEKTADRASRTTVYSFVSGRLGSKEAPKWMWPVVIGVLAASCLCIGCCMCAGGPQKKKREKGKTKDKRETLLGASTSLGAAASGKFKAARAGVSARSDGHHPSIKGDAPTSVVANAGSRVGNTLGRILGGPP